MKSAHGHGLLIGLGTGLLALALWFGHTLDGLENTTWSWRVQALAKTAPTTDQVVLILLDQASLDWGEQENGLPWPWPREVYVPILDFCRRAGTAATAFDVLFTEPSAYGVADDEALGEAIARNGTFVGARFLKLDAHGVTGSDEPIAEVGANARLLANVSAVPDRDGMFRRAVPARLWQDQPVPALGLAAWLISENLNIAALDSTLTAMNLAADQPALLRFRGPVSAFTTFSAAGIIQSELRLEAGENPTIDPDQLRGKIVLFGFSAPGLLDLRPTPVSRVSPGVMIHATMLDNLLNSDFMHRAPGWAVLVGTLLLALLAGWLAVLIHRVHLVILMAALLLVLPVAVGFGLYGPGLWWPIVPGILAVAGAVFGGVVRNYAVEGQQKRFIKQAFKHYLSPAVIARIMDNPEALKLGGERRELTIMFSDLAGFTSLSEGLEPEALTSLLNDYLTDMTDIILDEGGTLDKYEGDAIMAFWNAPLDQADHAARACRAAVRCRRQLIARAEEFRSRCGRPLFARIGIHTGDVIVGNMGSRQRFDYTVLGDAANLASRLEGANKAFGSAVMISATTLALAGNDFLVRPLGPVRVIGRNEPVEVLELTGLAGDPEPPSWEPFAKGLAAWRKGDTAAALDFFATCGDDPVARHCANMIDQAGVWVLDSK